MKKLLPGTSISIVLFLLSFVHLSAQTPSGSFQITHNGTATNIQEYQSAIQNANFEIYRLRNERVSLSFDNGLTFELLSAYEMQQAGYQVEIGSYRESNATDYEAPTLFLGPNGLIGAQYNSTNFKH